jgi:hypothetical protein
MSHCIIFGFFDPTLTEVDGVPWAVAAPVIGFELLDALNQAAYLHE